MQAEVLRPLFIYSSLSLSDVIRIDLKDLIAVS